MKMDQLVYALLGGLVTFIELFASGLEDIAN